MTDARIKKSQAALIQSGLILINKNKGISLTDIAKDAGVGRATLYRLYKSKEALIAEIALHCQQVFNQATQPIEKKAKSYMHAFELLFELTLPHTDELEFLSSLDYFSDQIPEVEAIFTQQDQALAKLIETSKALGEIDQSLPTSWLINYIDGLFYAAWTQQKVEGASVAESAQLAFRCFQSAVQKNERQ